MPHMTPLEHRLHLAEIERAVRHGRAGPPLAARLAPVAATLRLATARWTDTPTRADPASARAATAAEG